MELQAYKDGGSWDWPTFQALSELVTYDFGAVHGRNAAEV